MSDPIKLSAEEDVKPYAKYFYLEPAAPEPGLAKFLKSDDTMDTSKTLDIELLNDLLDPGYLEIETGYCILTNGAGYVSVLNQMLGVTVEMVNWWFAWHALEDLRYKIWWPQGHFGISISDEDRRKILKPNTKLTDKFQGIRHNVIEDVGGGKENIIINFLIPENAGFDMERFKSPNVGTVIIANGLSKATVAPEEASMMPAVMCHFIREIPGGVEFRSRFWLGYQIIDKKSVCLLPPGLKVPIEIPKGLMSHNILEYTNLKSILPKIFKEQGGIIS